MNRRGIDCANDISKVCRPRALDSRPVSGFPAVESAIRHTSQRKARNRLQKPLLLKWRIGLTQSNLRLKSCQSKQCSLYFESTDGHIFSSSLATACLARFVSLGFLLQGPEEGAGLGRPRMPASQTVSRKRIRPSMLVTRYCVNLLKILLVSLSMLGSRVVS